MDESSSDFRHTLMELIDMSPEPADHPSPDRWIAYHRGELSADQEALLQEHLARCRDCFDLAAGAAEFAQADEELAADSEMETAALWGLLRPQLDPPPQNVREMSPRPSRRFRLPTALAASFFVALVGMTTWNLQLRAPRPNVPSFEVAAAGERDAAGREQVMPAGPQMLVFHPAVDLPVYRLEIRDSANGRELVSEELRPDKDLVLNLYLPEGLPPGRYRMELSGGAGKVRETHLLRVKHGE